MITFVDVDKETIKKNTYVYIYMVGQKFLDDYKNQLNTHLRNPSN